MQEIVFIRRSSPAIGGIQGQIFRLASELYCRGIFQPVLITGDVNCGLGELFSGSGFEVFQVQMGKSKIMSTAGAIVDLLSCRNVGVIQSHMFQESIIARLVRRRLPHLFHVLRAQTYIDGVENSEWKKCSYHFLDRMTSRWVDRYLANGRYMADEIISRSKVEPKKVCVLLNGRDRIGLPDESCMASVEPLAAKIGMVSVFRHGKGHDCLLKALALLKDKGLVVKARLVGGEFAGGNLEQVKQLARRLGVFEQIEFYGFSEDIASALSGISVVVLPSDFEGVPNCLLEAMSLRKLVIASDCGGVGEIIIDRCSGLLHKPGDHSGFADCLEKVFTSPGSHWESLRDAGFARWQREFTLDIMVSKFIAIYRELGLFI